MALIRASEKAQREKLLKLQERLQAKGKDLSKDEKKLLDSLNRKYENLKKSNQHFKEKREKESEAKAKEKRKSERADKKARRVKAWQTAAVAPRDKDDEIIGRATKTGYSKDYFKGVKEGGTVKDKDGNSVTIDVNTGGGDPITKGKTWKEEPDKKRVDQPRSAESGQFTYNSVIGMDKVDKRDRAKGIGDLGEDPRFREDESGVGEIYEKMKEEGETEEYTYTDKNGKQVTKERLRGIKKGDVFVLKNGDTVVFTSDISVQQFYKYYMTNLKGEDSDEFINSLMEHGLIMKLGKKFQNEKDYEGETGVRIKEGIGAEALSASEQKEYDDLNKQIKESDKLPYGDPNKLSPEDKAAKWDRLKKLGDKKKAREALGSEARKKEFDDSRETWKTHRKNVTSLENSGIVDESSDTKLGLRKERGDRLGDISQFENLPNQRDYRGKSYDRYTPVSPTPENTPTTPTTPTTETPTNQPQETPKQPQQETAPKNDPKSIKDSIKDEASVRKLIDGLRGSVTKSNTAEEVEKEYPGLLRKMAQSYAKWHNIVKTYEKPIDGKKYPLDSILNIVKNAPNSSSYGGWEDFKKRYFNF